jgi:hypothetical protein
MSNQDELERKAKQVQDELQGLEVEYMAHDDKSLTPDMAKVNGYSIIWHTGAYCYGEPDTVEVMPPDGEIEGHYPISGLRELVTS